jgi:hypothetical protein
VANGIDVEGSVDVTIRSNLIGTDVNGTAAIPNGIGINGGGPGLVIGGTTSSQGNLVSGNAIGMNLFADGMTVQGNFVGVDDSHLVPLPNTSTALNIQSTASPAAANVIGTSTPGGPGREPDRLQPRPRNRRPAGNAQHDAGQLDPRQRRSRDLAHRQRQAAGR